jgi:hypothetical protein
MRRTTTKTTISNTAMISSQLRMKYAKQSSTTLNKALSKVSMISPHTPQVTADTSTEDLSLWMRIEQKCYNRDGSDECPICQETFSTSLNKQIILSCSHIFHSNCLQSYERYTRVKTCPLCRDDDYRKRETSIGYDKHILLMVIRY